jgi:aspartate racemase
MKKLGLIGGTSWVSTVDYYRYINEGVNQELGGMNYAECIIYSFNYADIIKNNRADDWEANFSMISKAAVGLRDGGADAIVLCANTMHLLADRVQDFIKLPLIHIATATGLEIKKMGLKKVGLLGTRFTMERDFFTNKLNEYQIESLIPGSNDRDFIHETIFEELGKGILNDSSKKRYLEIIAKLIAEGAEGIILGCTEIPLLIQPDDLTVPIFDTARIHCAAAVNYALGKS